MENKDYKKALESFDIEDLNMYEKVQFDVLTNTMGKADALNTIIEGATFISDLNPVLAEIVEEYDVL